MSERGALHQLGSYASVNESLQLGAHRLLVLHRNWGRRYVERGVWINVLGIF